MAKHAAALVVLLASLALSGCTQPPGPGRNASEERDAPASGDPSAWGTATNPASGFKEILLLDDRYDPVEFWIHAGTRIEFDAKGQHVHTATDDAAGFDTGDLSPAGAREFVAWFNATKDVAFHCRHHGEAGMRGTLHVVA